MEDGDQDAGAIAELGPQVLDALNAKIVTVKPYNGNVVEGSPAGLALRKKTKKGEATWGCKLSVETDSGTL